MTERLSVWALELLPALFMLLNAWDGRPDVDGSSGLRRVLVRISHPNEGAGGGDICFLILVRKSFKKIILSYRN